MATKNIVPRGNNEGQLGTDEKRWNTVIAETASFTTFSGSITGNEFTLFSGSATSTASFGFLSGDGRGLTNLTATADPAGSDTHVQFNDGGVTGGTAGFTYNKTTNSVTAITNITASGHISSSLTSTASFGRVNATSYSGDGSGLSGVTAGSVTFANVTSKPTLISGSAQIATYVSGAFHNTSSSLATRVTNLKTDSGSFSSRLTTAESELGNTLISGSAQIATYVSGAFTDASSSLATRATNLETDTAADSGSFSTRLTTAESEL